MAKDAPEAPAPAPAEPSRLETLRARLKSVAPGVKVERVAAVADTEKEPGSKAYVLASWTDKGQGKRCAHVVEPPHSLDDAECAVLSVVIANHVVS